MIIQDHGFLITNISNNNIGYENYANINNLINVELKVNDNITLNKTDFKVLVDKKTTNFNIKDFKLITDNINEKIYSISLTNISGNGSLSIFIPRNTVTDINNNSNYDTYLNTGIVIDNIKPMSIVGKDIKENIETIQINSNEKIRLPSNTWNMSDDNKILSKKVQNTDTSTIKLTDYAGNSSTISY